MRYVLFSAKLAEAVRQGVIRGWWWGGLVINAVRKNKEIRPKSESILNTLLIKKFRRFCFPMNAYQKI